jgi:16S rRNA (cytosine1402-N4)-methyltransferase
MYHLPVLLNESIEHLQISEGDFVADVTFGGGGHAKEILNRLGAKGRLVAFDQDFDANANVLKDERLIFCQANFRYIKKFLRLEGISKVDAVFADLGVSSHQFDEGSRGFSYRFPEAELDMRMNVELEWTAADVLNKYDAIQLQRVFSEYGEVRNSKELANAIVKARKAMKFERVGHLLELLNEVGRGSKMKYWSQVFQALRIEVNEEMQALQELLEASLDILKPGGRIVVISYHSIEDRMVKRFLKTGNVRGEIVKDDYGHIDRPFKLINKQVILPTLSEIRKNTRARSAKLRAANRK